ncbi:unnamed protein product, partial [Amoebophrya sp. A25]|eukprot:GSA25T00007830001.1
MSGGGFQFKFPGGGGPQKPFQFDFPAGGQKSGGAGSSGAAIGGGNVSADLFSLEPERGPS